jgi:hypothetical protein
MNVPTVPAASSGPGAEPTGAKPGSAGPVAGNGFALHTHTQHPGIWPRPGRAAPPVVLGAAAVAGLTAATVLPLGRLGLGWLITGFVLVGLGVLVLRKAPPPDRETSTTPSGDEGPTSSPGKPSEEPAGPAERRTDASLRICMQSKAVLPAALWAVVGLGLLAVTALRAAEWLGVLCVLSAAVAGSLAVAGGRSTRGLLLGAVAVPALALGTLPWAGRGLIALRAARRSGPNPPRIVAAVVVSVLLLAVFTPLLAGADAAFGRLVNDAIPTLSDQTIVRAILFTVFALTGLGAGYLLQAPERPDPVTVGAGRLRRVEWALPVGLLVALFGVFVAVSLATLFGGADHVLRTTGLTYAEYARGGFWQLLAVTLLTLPVIMVAGRNAATTTRVDRIWLRTLLGGLALLTLVIVASAMSRMWAYQQAYGFTVLRILVSAMELWLGFVYLLVLVAGHKLRAPWLPRAVVGSGLAALLVISIGNPDRFIADRNIDRWEHTGIIDVDYLRGLSADAVPALDRLPEPQRACVLGAIAADLAREPDDWRRWNLGRALARARVTDGAGTDPGCAMRPPGGR